MTTWFADNSLSIGKTPLVKLNRITDGAGATVLAQGGGAQPRLLREMPHRRRDGLGRREERVARAGEDDRRADLRKHRDRARLRRGGARLRDHPDDARDDERRAAAGAQGLRRQTGAHRRGEGDEGGDREGGGDRRVRPVAVLHAAAIQESRQPAGPRDDHGPGDLGGRPTGRSTSSSPASAPAGRSPGSPASSRTRRGRRSSRWRSSRSTAP